MKEPTKEFYAEAALYEGEAKMYAECMEEIVERFHIVNEHISKKTNEIATIEFMALQHRKIFELIVLASLVANSKEYTEVSKGFLTNWHPKNIINKLKVDHPNYYPIPAEYNIKDDINGGKIINVTPSNIIALTEQELLDGYGILGQYLHAWNPFTEKMDTSIIKKMIEWLIKIKDLISCHIIQFPKSNNYILVTVDFSRKATPSIHYVKT